MRINIEASYSLARLLEKMHHNESQAPDFVLRAYDWLPMPHKSVKPNRQTIQTIYYVLGNYKQSVQPFYLERSEQAIRYPYRALVNIVGL